MLGGKSTRQRQLITKAVLPESSLLAAQEPSTDPQSSWGWKAALEVAQSNTLLRAGSATTGCSGLCQSGFEDLQGWKLHHLSGQPAPACDHQQSESVFLCLDGISCISVCCHCHWSCHWAPLRRVWLHCLYSLHQEFISELSPSWPAPDLSASPCMTDRCFNPSITLVAFCRTYSSVSTSLTPGIPVLDSALLICLPLPLVTLCLLQPIALLAFLLKFHIQRGVRCPPPHSVQQGPFCKAASQADGPQPVLLPVIISSKMRDLASPCWTLRWSNSLLTSVKENPSQQHSHAISELWRVTLHVPALISRYYWCVLLPEIEVMATKTNNQKMGFCHNGFLSHLLMGKHSNSYRLRLL